MALQLGALRAALLEAGASPAAADEAAGYARLAKIGTDLTVLKWLAGVSLALGAGSFWMLVWITIRVAS